jgi:hypothetical protein
LERGTALFLIRKSVFFFFFFFSPSFLFSRNLGVFFNLFCFWGREC